MWSLLVGKVIYYTHCQISGSLHNFVLRSFSRHLRLRSQQAEEKRGGGFIMFSILKDTFTRKKEIDRQIEKYYNYRSEIYSGYDANEYKEWLLKFKEYADVEDVYKIKDEDVVAFKKWVGDEFGSPYLERQAPKYVNRFRRFYRAQKA